MFHFPTPPEVWYSEVNWRTNLENKDVKKAGALETEGAHALPVRHVGSIACTHWSLSSLPWREWLREVVAMFGSPPYLDYWSKSNDGKQLGETELRMLKEIKSRVSPAEAEAFAHGRDEWFAQHQLWQHKGATCVTVKITTAVSHARKNGSDAQ